MDSNIRRSSILGPTGQKLVMLGGDVYDQRITGDIISEYKWVDGEPVMLLYKRVLGTNTQAYMIEFKDAYKFATSSGNATKELVQQLCKDAARAINAENDKATIFRLIDIILNGLPDLLMMPPEPKAHEIANRPTSGNDELKVTDRRTGETLIEIVV